MKIFDWIRQYFLFIRKKTKIKVKAFLHGVAQNIKTIKSQIVDYVDTKCCGVELMIPTVNTNVKTRNVRFISKIKKQVSRRKLLKFLMQLNMLGNYSEKRLWS